MSLAPGTRIGPYEIVAAIGAGGMGEVYRATDTTLGRAVAIKILPDDFARDPARLARFEHEARTLASLSHPNIAQVYGFQERALILELLEGETLRDRMAGDAVPMRKAIEFGSQVARGLAAAHERGIIHRDLKPENVFLLRDGQVKILDFGLARQVATAGSGATETQAGAFSTDPGTVMGTVGYMSPEQVRGDALDQRSDLFALGAVLYEMLTGRRAFRRDTTAETMTAILKEDPPELTAARADLTPALDRIVRHCLEKNPIERFQTARDVAFALDSLSGSGSAAAAVGAAPPARTRERWVWAAVTAVMAAGLLWMGFASRAGGPEPPKVAYRVTIPLPADVAVGASANAPPAVRLAFSPDGHHVAFVGYRAASLKQELWILSLEDGSAREVRGSEGAVGPFWSPDSRRFVFTANERMRIGSLDNENTVDFGPAGVGHWNANDVLTLSSGPPEFRLRRVTVTGSDTMEWLKPAAGDFYSVPVLLPGDRRLLYGLQSNQAPASSGIYVAAPDMTRRTLVTPLENGTTVQYADRALLFVRGSTLMAQTFDPDTARLDGEPKPIAEHVDLNPRGAAYSVSSNGMLIYTPTPQQSASRLVWMDRAGRELSRVGDEADYSNLELSPDGKRLLVSVPDAATRTRDIHIVDLARGVRQRLTFDPSDERSAVWSPDGRRVVYTSKGLDLYMRSSDFSGDSTPVEVTHLSKDPQAISPDGTAVMYRQTGVSTGNDLWLVPLAGGRTPKQLAGSTYNENYGRFSPDGRSVVMVSEDSGQSEVYVMSIESGAKIQVSAGGGSFPRWRRDGREIFYLRGDQMMSVDVSGTGATFRASTPKPMFQVNTQPGPGAPFDVTADGQRFIVNATPPRSGQASLNLIVNWTALMRKP